MAENYKRIRRKNFFIKKQYQTRFILHFFLIVIVCGGISTGLLFLFSSGSLTSSFHRSQLLVTNTAKFLLPLIVYTNLVTVILVSLAVIVVTLFVSHKIAGPLFRMEQDVKQIAEGDLTKVIHLRQNDQLKDFSEDINKMTESWRQRIENIHDRLDHIMREAGSSAPDLFVEEMQQLKLKVEKEFKI